MGVTQISFYFKPPTNKKDKAEYPDRIKALNEGRCEVCPMQTGGRCGLLNSPQMKPGGSSTADFYILAEAPGKDEDNHGSPLVGISGQLLRGALYKVLGGELLEGTDPSWGKMLRYTNSLVRFNNVIRCHPENNRDPSWEEVEACRLFIVEDIEKCRPSVIMGTGNVPLRWMTGEAGITKWRGRVFPVQIGSHACWYAPLLHPAYVARMGGLTGDLYPIFVQDVVKAVKSASTPVPETRMGRKLTGVYDGVELFHGNGKSTGEREKSIEHLLEILESFQGEDFIALDIETNGLRPYVEGAKILSIAIGTHKKIVSVALDHPESGWSKAQRNSIQDILLWLFSKEFKPTKVAHNFQFEAEWIGFFFGPGVLEESSWGCSLAQAYVLGDRRQSMSLDDLCLQSFGVPLKSLSEVDVRKLEKTPIEDVLKYNSLDTKWTYPLFEVQLRDLKKGKLLDLYREQIERIVAAVFMQLRGVPLDLRVTEELDEKLSESLSNLRYKINVMPKVEEYKIEKDLEEFNPGSPKQVLEVLRDFYKAPEIVDQKTGKETTKEEVLKEIESPFASGILLFRGLSKLQSTYIKGFLEGGKYAFPDGRMHPIFHTNRTSTRRLSSSDPNGQNFPREGWVNVKRQVAAGDGNVMICVDYAQIEARVLGMYSKDKFLIKSLHQNYDIHMSWTEILAEEFPSLVGGYKNIGDPKAMKKLRTAVKNQFVFPLFYGAEAWSCLGYMGLGKSRINSMAAIVDRFWETFSGVRKWQESQIRKYNRDLEISAPTGFRYPGPLTQNQIFNWPIQGGASDICVSSMVSLHKRAYQEGIPELRPILNIHDDLSFIVPKDKAEEYLEIILDEMLKFRYSWINVPLRVEVSVGSNWGEQEEIGQFQRDSSESEFYLVG